MNENSNSNTGHTKYYNKTGEQVPSCTTIVKLLNKPELVSWANYMGFRRIDVNRFLNERATYGTMCHSVAECYLSGFVPTKVPFMTGLSQQEYSNLLQKLEFIQNHFLLNYIRIIRTELQLHGERYGGTLDLLCQNEITGDYILYDFKTSKKCYDTHFIQLAGYTLLLEELFQISISEIGIILLSKEVQDKTFITMKKKEENRKNEEIFMKLVDIYWLQNKEKGDYRV